MRRRQLPGEPPPPTKSELKRQAQDVQALADRLIEAPAALVEGLALPEKLADAVALARRITSHGAALRQRQFVGKLLRRIDTGAVREALDGAAQEARLAAARFRRAERWRDRLIDEGPPALEALLEEFPAADAAELSRLLTSARRQKAPGAARALFRRVQSLIEG